MTEFAQPASRALRSDRHVRSRPVLVPRDNIDTDQIVPAPLTLYFDDERMADSLFRWWRDGDPAFPLDDPANAGRTILVAGANFGCGSSREHAVWALRAWGFQTVIARGFAPIFRSNAAKNGLVCVDLDAPAYERALASLAPDPDAVVDISIRRQAVTIAGRQVATFELEADHCHLFLTGGDELDLILAARELIAAYSPARLGPTRRCGSGWVAPRRPEPPPGPSPRARQVR